VIVIDENVIETDRIEFILLLLLSGCHRRGAGDFAGPKNDGANYRAGKWKTN